MVKGVHQHVTGEAPAPATAGAFALPEGGAPEWVPLFPYGTYHGRDGRGPYTLRDQAHARAVITDTMAYQAGADLPFDYDHQTQRSLFNGKPAPAAGWIKDLQARDDGIWARVEWTGPAAQSIELKEFRYVSPTFFGAGANNTGPVTRIVGAGLTNTPNFTLPAIASQTHQGDNMDPELLKLLGLPATASQADVMAAIKKLQGGHAAVCKVLGIPDTTTADQVATAAQAALAPLAAALKVDAGAGLPAMASAAQTAMTGTAQVDLTKWVPMAVHVETASQLKVLQGQVATTEADRAVADAIQAGKVPPAQKAWAAEFASQNLAGFQSYVATAPVLVTPATASQQTTAAPPTGQPATGQQLTADEVAVANQLGLTAEQFLKTKKGA